MLIDSHAHLLFPGLKEDIPGVIERARASGVEYIINIGTGSSKAENGDVVELAHKYPGVFATVGLHPHEAVNLGTCTRTSLNAGTRRGDATGGPPMTRMKMGEGVPIFRASAGVRSGRTPAGGIYETGSNYVSPDFSALSEEWKQLVRSDKVVAVGEIGLDYHYNDPPREVQVSVFREMIRFAREVELPLIIHCRDAFEDAFKILEEEEGFRFGGVLHCYSGDLETASKFIDKGFYISFPGIITFKKARVLQDVARQIPLDRILIETDSPYLAPEPHRGKTNEPAYVRFVAEKLAELREISFEEVANATTRNAISLFGLSRFIRGQITFFACPP